MDILHNNTKQIYIMVKAYFDYGYAHIFDITMSDDVWNILFPCGITVFLCV